MAQHTPAPWSFGPLKHNRQPIHGPDNLRVATVFIDRRGNSGVVQGDGLANARLIAASPVMLDYVRRCASNCAEANDILRQVEGER